MAPLNFLGSSFSLNLFKLKYENNNDIFEYKFCVRDSFKVSVKNFAVPSAVFKAIFPVKPSVTMTFEFPSVILFPSI